MLITLKRAHCFPLARGSVKKGTAAEVCREVILSYVLTALPCAMWSPAVPQRRLLHCQAFRRTWSCSRTPVIWEAAHWRPSISGVGDMEMVWTEVEVASRSWLMATPLRLRFLGHPTCPHHIVVSGWCWRPSATGVCCRLLRWKDISAKGRVESRGLSGTLPRVMKGQNVFEASICHVMNQDLFVASYFCEWGIASCVFP